MVPKRRRVALSDTAQEYEPVPSSPFAREALVSKPIAEILSTLPLQMSSTDQSAARMSTTRQIKQPVSLA